MERHQPRFDMTRRQFVTTSAVAAAALARGSVRSLAAGEPTSGAIDPKVTPATSCPTHPLLTAAEDFQDVSRGNPKPYTLKGEALEAARLTPESWRLELIADSAVDDAIPKPASITKSATLTDGNAIDLPALMELGRQHGVMYLKAMQCLNIPTPLGQGLWEGVPLRELLRLCGSMSNVRRVYYWGFHNNDPKQLFQSSLSYTQAMETPPGEMPAFLAYRLNGQPIPLLRGGPVRMIVPWAHGFKSIKWLQRIVLTNDYRANDTYANANNDPESHLKTAAYLDAMPDKVPAGRPLFISGLAIAGLSGLGRVEYWMRPVEDGAAALAEDDIAWTTARWEAGRIEDPPADWSALLPEGVLPRQLLGFDPHSGRPLSWPLRYSMVSWSAMVDPLTPGKYEVRARAVDLNGYAQPEPRPIQKAGKNQIQVRTFVVE